MHDIVDKVIFSYVRETVAIRKIIKICQQKNKNKKRRNTTLSI